MRSWLAVAAAAALVACAPAGSPRVTAAPDPGTPLEARLFPPYYGQVALRLSKPAYVALFEVVPGRGVSLLYPQAGAGWQGTTEVWVPMRYNPQRWMYTTSAASAAYGYGVAGAPGYDAYGMPDGGVAAPRYLFLVASDRPLAVDQFQGDPTSMRSYLGHVSYASYEPYAVMERLAYAILPFASEESWVTDVYVDWGYDWGYGAGPAATSAFASYHRVRCADGSLGYARYLTGWGMTDASCSIAGWVDPVPGGPIVGPQPDDSSVVVPPGSGRSRAGTSADDGRRRAAEPATDDGAAAQAAARVRQLRADAERPDFRDEVDALLRESVRTRQRTDRLLGYDEPSVWTETRVGTDAAARARAEERRRRPGESALDRADAERRETSARAAERAAERERMREPRARGASGGSGSAGEPRSRAGSDPAGGSGASSTRRATAEPSGSSGSSGSSSSGSSGSSSSGSSGGRKRVPPG